MLAGVTISQLTGNGLLEKVKQSKEETINAQEYENEILESYEKEIKKETNQHPNYSFSEDKNVNEWLSKLDDEPSKIKELLNNSTTLQEIVDNQNLINKLMNSESAVDYMITNKNIMDTIKNNSNAIIELGNSKYASYQTIMNKDSREAILNSPYSDEFDKTAIKVPLLTNNENVIYSSYANENVPYQVFDKTDTLGWCPALGEVVEKNYIGYHFNEDVICYKIKVNFHSWRTTYVRKMVFQASDDSEIYNDITVPFDFTVGTHIYYPNKLISCKYVKIQGISGYGLYFDGEMTDAITEMQFYCVGKY